MTRGEFQKMHGLSDIDIERIDDLVKIFDGKIVNIALANANKECIIRYNQ